MTYSIDVTEDGVCTALRAWLIDAIGGEVVRGLDNRVAMPKGGFIAMTPGTQQRLATNTATYNADVTQSSKTLMQPVMQGVQLDFYGAQSSNWAAIISTIWPDEATCSFLTEQFGGIVQPLYCSDPMQMALIDGEEQYVERWIVKAFMQYNGVVSLNQQFFTGVDVTLVDVDANYH